MRGIPCEGTLPSVARHTPCIPLHARCKPQRAAWRGPACMRDTACRMQGAARCTLRHACCMQRLAWRDPARTLLRQSVAMRRARSGPHSGHELRHARCPTTPCAASHVEPPLAPDLACVRFGGLSRQSSSSSSSSPSTSFTCRATELLYSRARPSTSPWGSYAGASVCAGACVRERVYVRVCARAGRVRALAVLLWTARPS